MSFLVEFYPFILMMLCTGAFAGILAGLLGVGGGIVIVPVLEFALGVYGVDPEIRMHIAVATSLACIVLTSISSSRAHHKRGALDLSLIMCWGPFVFIGSLVGALLASKLNSQTLTAIFGVVALVVAIKMALFSATTSKSKDSCSADYSAEKNSISKNPLVLTVPFGIGSLSSMMGIGGGTFSVPVLTMMKQPIHKAVGTAAFFGFLISLPGVVGFMLTGFGISSLPAGSIGYVNVIGFALISPVSVLFAPLGVYFAHKLSSTQLSRFFAVFLFIVAVRMIYRSIA